MINNENVINKKGTNNKLKQNSNFYAGLISGIVSNIVCNPFDVIRTNNQLSNKIEYSSTFLSRGLLAGFVTIPMYWSMYFESYNTLNYYNTNYFKIFNGYIASNIAATITCPLWFIRQKHQTTKKFSIINFYNKKGIYPFYNALLSTYIINGSFIIQMPVYEKFKNSKYLSNTLIYYNYENKIHETLSIFIITAFSKTIASCVFYPFDTIRAIKRENDSLKIIDIIYKLNKNPYNYYNGLRIYLVRSIPYHCTTFCVFEFMKNKIEKLK